MARPTPTRVRSKHAPPASADRRPPVREPTVPRPRSRPTAAPRSSWTWSLVGLGFVALLTAVVGGAALLSVGPFAQGGVGGADDGRGAAVVQGVGGQWSEITVDDLDAMLAAKDFTLLNVKTPYIGEIDATDLYIPYDQLVARAGDLPTDKAAKLVVYCRTGNQSGIAAQILVDLGYTNVVNVDGGMVAWAESGRPIVQRDRS